MKQPAGQPLPQTVRAVAGGRDHHLLEEGVHMSVHEGAECGHRIDRLREGPPRHLRGRARKLDEEPAEELLAPNTA